MEKLRICLKKSMDAGANDTNDAVVFLCKSCGSSLSLLNGGKCESCGQGLELVKYDWVIADYQVI